MKRRDLLAGLGAATSVAFLSVGAVQAESAADAELGPEYEDPGCSDLGSCRECLDNNCFDCTDYC